MIENITTKKKRKRGAGYLTEQQEREALSLLVRPDARTLFLFLLETGLRISEALIVEVADIERGYTTLIGKGGKERTVHYRPELMRELQRFVAARQLQPGQDSTRLFPFNRQTAHRLLSPADVYPHLLRHTYLTRLLRRTNDIRLVQEVAGHADIRTTSKYTHFTQEEIRRAMIAPRGKWERIRRVFLSVFGL